MDNMNYFISMMETEIPELIVDPMESDQLSLVIPGVNMHTLCEELNTREIFIDRLDVSDSHLVLTLSEQMDYDQLESMMAVLTSEFQKLITHDLRLEKPPMPDIIMEDDGCGTCSHSSCGGCGNKN